MAGFHFYNIKQLTIEMRGNNLFSKCFFWGKGALLAFFILTNTGLSQTDANAPVFGVDYFPKMMTYTAPNKAYTLEPYGIDAIVSVGPFDNIRATTVAGFGEPHILVNPTNPLNFVAGDNRAVVSSSNIYVTNDGGLNWSNVSTGSSQGDPVFAFDHNGWAYYTVLFNGVRVWRSTNGGTSWSNLGNAFSTASNVTDKQWVAGDQTNGTYSNYLYLTYSDFTTQVAIKFYRSTNNGSSWTGPTTLYGPGSAQGSNVEVGPDGKVYAVWYGSGGASLRMSTDGGSSWTTSQTIAAYTEPGVLHSSGRLVLKGDIRVNGFPQIAVDKSGGPFNGNVYLNYSANSPGPDNADVYVVRSTNGGVNWNTFTPTKINDDATLFDQWMSDISVDNQGRVWVFWYDSRNDPGNLWTEAYGSVSTDGGATFSPNFKISNQPFNPNVVKQSQGSGQAYYIGDYQSISGSTITLPFWMDGRQNSMMDYTATLPDFGIDFSGPDTLYSNVNASVGKPTDIPVLGPYAGSVQFTHTISPTPGAGSIGITFTPNPLTSFPSSVNIQADVSATVPFGTYDIIVTGTDNSISPPRVHTRTLKLIVSNLVGIGNNSQIPDQFALQQNYPNPFNPSTSIAYSIPQQSFVTLKVYDMLGREVASLVNELKQAGNYNVQLNASDLSSGVYYYRIKAGDFVETRRMVLMK
ncbi:MAG: T9SS type A sorting domain-containing protein [Ignavibacteriae bacterium]|nr:T9SS type A sorting domain-containing protein [Ignavibacteriota bacterium]